MKFTHRAYEEALKLFQQILELQSTVFPSSNHPEKSKTRKSIEACQNKLNTSNFVSNEWENRMR